MPRIVKTIPYDKNPVEIGSLGTVGITDVNTNDTSCEIIGVLISSYSEGPEKAVITKQTINHYHSWDITCSNLHNGKVKFDLVILAVDQP